MNKLSSFRIICNLHQCISGIKLLAEFYNTCQIIIKKFFGLQIKFTFTQAILITFHHHEDNLLIFIGTLEEIRKISLFLNLLRSFLHILQEFLRVLNSVCIAPFMLIQIFNSLRLINILLFFCTVLFNLILIFIALFAALNY